MSTVLGSGPVLSQVCKPLKYAATIKGKAVQNTIITYDDEGTTLEETMIKLDRHLRDQYGATAITVSRN